VPSGATDIRSVADSVALDWVSVRAFLAAHGHVLETEPPPRQFAGGLANLNYLIRLDGAPAVLRRPPLGELPAGSHDMAREHRILSRLPDALAFVPRSLFLCADAAVLGAPFQIIEYRPGMVIRDTLPPGMAGRPETGILLSRQLVECLAALHAVDPVQVGLETLGRPAGFLARTVDGWAARGAAVADLINPLALSEVLDWLRRRAPTDAPPSLIHSDFKLDNMILVPETLAPVAVIDWDMGTRGDPLWDLAVMLSYWVEPDDPPRLHRVRQMPTAQPGFWRRHEVLAAYLRLSSRAVGDFTFYRVLSLFRAAVVFLQLYDRFRRSPGQNMRCAEFDTLGRELLDHAFEVIHGRAE